MLPFQQRLWASEQFAWDIYPRVLAQLGFRTKAASDLMVREVLRHRERIARILD
jgi:hypothetical protein